MSHASPPGGSGYPYPGAYGPQPPVPPPAPPMPPAPPAVPHGAVPVSPPAPPQGVPYSTGPFPPTTGAPPSGVQPDAGRSRSRNCLSAFLGVVGALALLVGGGVSLITYSMAQQDVRNRSGYGPTIWRNASADRLFPEILSPQIDTQSDGTDPKLAQWKRLGIAQQTGCDDGLSGAPAEQADEFGCKAVLRATYVGSGTVALVVFPKKEAADKMRGFLETEWDEAPVKNGVHAFAVPDTPAAGWKDTHRNGCSGATAFGPYLPYAIVASVGSVDGRQAGKIPRDRYVRPKDDRIPWHQASETLVEDFNMYLQDLMSEETAP